MQLHSTECVSSVPRRAMILASTFPDSGAFPIHIPELVVASELDEVVNAADSAQRPSALILLETSPAETFVCAECWLSAPASTQGTSVEYWCRANCLGVLVNLLESSIPLSVGGIFRQNGWLRVLLIMAQDQDRGIGDFVAGLRGAQPDPMDGRKDLPAVTLETNLRGLLIAQIVPLAKPFKKYIPASAVIGMYKILEKIR